MNIENFISDAVRRSVEALYGTLDGEQLQIQKTRKEFEGDYTLVTFPLLRRSRKSPEATAAEIGEHLTAHMPEVKSFNVIKGFLNLALSDGFWADRFAEIAADGAFGQAPATGRNVMIEYSSPNTNKPLHLGHIRNNLLGYSVAQILKANGHNVIKANLVNYRGIHICKSMLAWKLYGNGETPATSGMKGDHLVGKYYVEFDKHYKAQIKELMAQGQSEEEAKKNAPVMLEAQEMLRKWEARDPEVYSLWETMNARCTRASTGRARRASPPMPSRARSTSPRSRTASISSSIAATWRCAMRRSCATARGRCTPATTISSSRSSRFAERREGIEKRAGLRRPARFRFGELSSIEFGQIESDEPVVGVYDAVKSFLIG